MSQPQRTQGTQEIAERRISAPLSPMERDRVRGKETLNPPDHQTDARDSIFEQIEALVVCSDPFPLTPALSLGEWENLSPCRAKPGALGITGRGDSAPLSPRERDRVRGKGTLNPPRLQTDVVVSTFEQIEALVVNSAPFPLTPALSLGDRENLSPRWAKAGALGITGRGDSDPLSPRERDMSSPRGNGYDNAGRVRGKGTLNPPRRQTDAVVSTFEQIEALVVNSAPFPLTPALSLGERENLSPHWAKPGASGITGRGDSDPLSPRERDMSSPRGNGYDNAGRVRGKGTLNLPRLQTDAVVSTFEQIEALVVNSAPFPLTPALSL